VSEQRSAQSVQSYIDERPQWVDGTSVSGAPLTPMQWRILGLATAGKFFEGLVVFMTGVALPLIVQEFGLGAADKGLVGAAPLFGILVGATALGGLGDVFGRKPMFIAEMMLFALFLCLLTVSPSLPLLVFFLFGMGVALGCDYPTAHVMISESIPSRVRGRLVLGAFGFQAVGALVGTFVGFLVLYARPDIGAWRWMYATAIVPALLVVAGRFYVTESAHWLVTRGRLADAGSELLRLLDRRPPYPTGVRLVDPYATGAGGARKVPSGHLGMLFTKQHRRATLLASVPWFLQDLGTYGIGIFTPTILAATVGAQDDHPLNVAGLVLNDMIAAKGAAMLDVLLIIGIIAAVLLVDRAGRIRLQILGFLGCALGLALAALSMNMTGQFQTVTLFCGFMLFNFMTNLGPNAQTYLLAGEVFPTRLRAKGAGFAASFAKLGAVATAFLFPILLAAIGTQYLLAILVGTSLLGAFVTWMWRIETSGVNLETVGHASAVQTRASTVQRDDAISGERAQAR